MPNTAQFPEVAKMHPNLWPPFANLALEPAPLKVKSAKGVWLELEDGHRIIDAISSWWVNVMGHGHPDIAKAIYEQALELEQVLFAGFTHDPAEQIAEKVADKLPGTLERVFFSDDGSTACEVAMKMAYQYWYNLGQKRQTFIAFEGAYHGDTFGAMSVGDRNIFTAVLDDLLFDVEFVPFPNTWMGDETVSDREDAVIDQIEKLLDEHPQKYAGIMIEPMVQGAGGIKVCREEFMQKLHWVNRQYETLLIFDEVMTGFGRTGDWFASLRAQVEPDLICLAKGLTGGFVPLSLTVASREVFEVFLDADPYKAMYHGHSFTANPIGCAAALATMKLLEENERLFMEMDQRHLEQMKRFVGHPKLEQQRVCGTISAMNVKTKEQSGYLNSVSREIRKRSIAKGALIRPLGEVIYMMPPYTITDEELTRVYDVIEEVLAEI